MCSATSSGLLKSCISPTVAVHPLSSGCCRRRPVEVDRATIILMDCLGLTRRSLARAARLVTKVTLYPRPGDARFRRSAISNLKLDPEQVADDEPRAQARHRAAPTGANVSRGYPDAPILPASQGGGLLAGASRTAPLADANAAPITGGLPASDEVAFGVHIGRVRGGTHLDPMAFGILDRWLIGAICRGPESDRMPLGLDVAHRLVSAVRRSLPLIPVALGVIARRLVCAFRRWPELAGVAFASSVSGRTFRASRGPGCSSVPSMPRFSGIVVLLRQSVRRTAGANHSRVRGGEVSKSRHGAEAAALQRPSPPR